MANPHREFRQGRSGGRRDLPGSKARPRDRGSDCGRNHSRLHGITGERARYNIRHSSSDRRPATDGTDVPTTQATSPPSATRTPAPGETRLVEDVLAYAASVVDGSAEVNRDIFAPTVVLDVYERLGDGPVATGPRDLTRKDAWQVDELFNLAEFMNRIRDQRDYVVITGRDPYCAGEPLDPPRGYDDRNLVAVVRQTGFDSCLQWFAVDMYRDDKGRVTYLRAQLWER